MTPTRRPLLAAAALALAVAVPHAAAVAAEEVPPTTLSLDEIVERHLAARGGAPAMRAIETLVYSGGTYREADFRSDGTAFMAFRRPYFRVVGNPEEPGVYMEGYDGTAWEWLGDPGIVVRTVGAAAGATRRGTLFMGPFLDYREQGIEIELGEPEAIDGRPADRLVVTTRDGFVREYFLDRETRLVVAERRSAPFHAFGDPVTSETRVGDHREVAGVLVPHRFRQTDLATGETMSEMQWGKVEANRDLPASWFSPPEFERTRLQRFLEHLYLQRSDREAVLWSYHEFRRAWPDEETAAGVEAIGYQMLKMGDHGSAVALLAAHQADHPDRADAAFSLGRAHATAGDAEAARAAYRRALELDPEHRRATEGLEALAAAGEGGDGSPAAVLEAMSAAMGAGDWEAAARRMHPRALEELRTALSTLAGLDPSGATAEAIFGSREPGADGELAPAEVYVRFMRWLAGQSPEMVAMLASAEIEVLGSVAEGDTVHVVFRTRVDLDGAGFGAIDVAAFERADGEWRALLSGDVADMVRAIDAQAGRAGAASER